MKEMKKHEMTQGQQLPVPQIETLYKRFIDYIDVKPRTAETYSKAIKQFYVYIRSRGITAPNRQDVIQYRDYLLKDHKPATVQLYIIALKRLFKWADQNGLYDNIAADVKAPNIDRTHKKSYLTSEQALTVISDSQDNKRNYAILCLMITTGIRTVEVTRANIEDLDIVAGQPVLFIQGKGKDDRRDYVKLAAETETAIKGYLQGRTNAKAKDPLFISESNRNGGRLTTRSVSRIVKNALIKAGFESERLTAHSLRHTAAHLNLENGGTVEETRDLLRHGNVATTYIYINEMNREKNNSENRIAAAIFKGGKR